MSIPEPGTKEWEAEAKFYSKSTQKEKVTRAKQLGYKNAGSYISMMVRNGACQDKRGTVPPLDVKPVKPAAPVEEAPGLSEEESRIIQIIKGSKVPVSVSELSRQLDRCSETVIKFIDSLRVKHYEVTLDEDSHSVTIPETFTSDFKPTEFKYYRKSYKIGCASDTHLCSKYQQLTLLHDAYAIFDREKVDFIVHAGDLVDGVGMYPGHTDEVFKHGADEQSDYAIRHYPRSARGTKTYLIGGQHDYVYVKRNGYNILKTICKDRKDLIYRGFFSAVFKVKDIYLSLQHPGGGVAYARSYKLQKILEGMAGEMMEIARSYPEKLKLLPLIVWFGHWHVKAMLPEYMGMDGISLPCFQAQTTYLKQKGLSPNIGCMILEISLNENGGLGSVKPNFINMTGQKREKDY
jgi:predicted phosphodiesterase